MIQFKTMLKAGIATALLAGTPALAQDVKIGALFEVTGPIASFVPPILNAAKLAESQVNAQGGILNGRQVRMVVVDGQGSPQGAVDAATKLVNVENVAVIVGPLMSGSLIAAANSVTIPAGTAILSPSATSPAITDLKDNDTVFRVAPSDAYQGVVLAKMVMDRGIKNVALTFVNNDYAVGLSGTFRKAYLALGGTIAADQVHETKKTSFRAELATLAAKKPQALVVIAMADDTGVTVIKQALEGGFFDTFIGTDGLKGDITLKEIGADNLKKSFFSSPSTVAGPASAKFTADYTAAYKDGADKLFVTQSYDVAFMAALAVQAAGSTDKAAVKAALRKISAPGGEAILPGEWKKAVDALKAGKAITYQGAGGPTAFDAAGDVPGVIGEFVVEGAAFKQIKVHAPSN